MNSEMMESIRKAAKAIKAGQVVAYPTETVYGLGADPFSEKALDRLFEIKGRDKSNPVLLIAADERQLLEVVAEIPSEARACMEAFWPGPLCLLFPKKRRVPEALTAGSDRVCVRQTSSKIARCLCLEVGHAITSSSANRSGKPPARSASEIELPGLAAIVDGGILPPALPSTIYDPYANRILRAGAIAPGELAKVLNKS